MTYKWQVKNFNFILIVLALFLSIFSINIVSASGVIIYDDPSVPHAVIPSGGNIININNSFTNITNVYTSINQTINESLWIETINIAGRITLHPINLSQNVGIGTNESAYDLEVKNIDGIDIDGGHTNNTYLGISSGSGNANASLMFREDTAIRYNIMYDGLRSVFQIYSYAIDRAVLIFNTAGDAEFTRNVTMDARLNVIGNLTAPNICYANGTNCNATSGSTYNSSYVPYTGAIKNVDLGVYNLTLNGTIYFPEGWVGTSGIKPILQVNPVGSDAFTLEYNYNFELANDDWVVFKKTDGNDADPDGGFAFVMVNASGYNKIKIKIDGYDLVNFTNQNIITTGNITASNITASNFFGNYLGSAIARFLKLFVINLDVSGNATIYHLNTTNGAGIGGNLIVMGNFSAKRPYFNGYDNSTQNFLNTANSQVMNLTNNADYDAWLINITDRQNITFQQTGDYMITVSPEFYQASGTNKIITFWMQKNGIDIPWSNSRYTISNENYFAPSIVYQVDITNPATDNIRIMWYSDSVSTQIISVSGLTLPTRPSIPGVLINIQKISEITP